MTHFGGSVQLELHFKKAYNRKGRIDGAGGTIKRVVFWVGEIKKNHDKHSGEICQEGVKVCAVFSINLLFPR